MDGWMGTHQVQSEGSTGMSDSKGRGKRHTTAFRDTGISEVEGCTMSMLRARMLRRDVPMSQEKIIRCKHCRPGSQKMGYDGILVDIEGTEFCTMDLREYCNGKEDPGCGSYEL